MLLTAPLLLLLLNLLLLLLNLLRNLLRYLLLSRRLLLLYRWLLPLLLLRCRLRLLRPGYRQPLHRLRPRRRPLSRNMPAPKIPPVLIRSLILRKGRNRKHTRYSDKSSSWFHACHAACYCP